MDPPLAALDKGTAEGALAPAVVIILIFGALVLSARSGGVGAAPAAPSDLIEVLARLEEFEVVLGRLETIEDAVGGLGALDILEDIEDVLGRLEDIEGAVGGLGARLEDHRKLFEPLTSSYYATPHGRKIHTTADCESLHSAKDVRLYPACPSFEVVLMNVGAFCSHCRPLKQPDPLAGGM